MFVTWHKKTRDDDLELRGCIGNFNPMPLHSGFSKYALIRYTHECFFLFLPLNLHIFSALQDRRFSPITLSEIPSLTCGVSLLTNFEVADNYLDWEVGTHGIWIEFIQANGEKETATYLPEVMKDQGWTKEEAIKSLLRKGGFRGPVTRQYCIISITLTRYQSQKLEQPYKG